MDAGHRTGVNWSRIAGWVLSLAALAFVVRWLWQLDRSIWQQLTQMEPAFLLLALVWFLGWFWLRFVGWKMISQRHGYQGPTRTNIRMWALSEFMRYIPGNVWSFAARWRGAVAAGVSKTGAVQSLVIEALGLVGGAIMVAGILVKPEWWWLALVVLVVYVVMTPKLIDWLWRRRATAPPHFSSIELLQLIGLYAVTWMLFGLATAAIYYSFPTPPPVLIIQLVGYSVLAWMIGYLSLITPMGFGVREAAFVVLLSPLIGPGFASLISVVSRLWLIVSELVFLGLVMIPRRQ